MQEFFVHVPLPLVVVTRGYMLEQTDNKGFGKSINISIINFYLGIFIILILVTDILLVLF